MEVSVCLLFFLLNICLAAVLVLGQDQSGFISLDCGSPPDTKYIEEGRGINYISDAKFIDTGVERSIQPEYRSGYQRHLWNLRSFPKGFRNCYTLNLTQGDKYLIRADFLYGNYDGLNNIPMFDLHLGPNFWTSVNIRTPYPYYYYEMIHLSKANHLQVCLVNTGSSTPFISALELRKLPNRAYDNQKGSLRLVQRKDSGRVAGKNLRYPIDVFDRIWQPDYIIDCKQTSTNKTVDIDTVYKPPETIMQTACVPTSPYMPLKNSLMSQIINGAIQLYMVLHIAEIQELKLNETREFNILYNGKHWDGPYRPDYLDTTSINLSSTVEPDANGDYEISLQRTENSTLPPLLNAMEVYVVIFLSQTETDKKEVDAMLNIKSRYNLKIMSWQGDPCAPQEYRWDGLNCSYNGNEPPMITSLNLSSTRLNGTILNSISNLTNLEIIDLSNNSLTGSIPEFLAEMETLKVLNLSGNMLNGSVPTSLLEKSRKGLISLSIGENPRHYTSTSRTKKKKTIIVTVVAPVTSVLLFVATLATLLIFKRDKKSKRGGMHSSSTHAQGLQVIERTRSLTYSELLKITNNFEKILGRGGYGVVYYGVLDNNPVAVKMLSEASAQGYKQFKAEEKEGCLF